MGFDLTKGLIPASELTISDAPYQLTLGGVTYTLLKGTERFSTEDDPDESFTFYQLLQKHFPKEFKSKAKKLEIPEELYLIGRAGRCRVIRAVQMHYDPPPALDPILAAQLEGSYEAIEREMEDNLTLPAQVSYAKWAAGGDVPTAMSLILHYGWARTPEPRTIEQFCLYKLSRTDDGIIIDIEYAHTFQERLEAACAAALQRRVDDIRRGEDSSFRVLQQIGIAQFFFYKKRYVSATPEFNTMIKTTIQHYIQKIIKHKDPITVKYPEIEEPVNIMPDPEQPLVLKWEDFSFVDLTKAELQQRRDNNATPCLENFQRRFNHLPQDVPVTFAELGRPRRETIAAGIKYGFISRTGKRGEYKLHYPKGE